MLQGTLNSLEKCCEDGGNRAQLTEWLFKLDLCNNVIVLEHCTIYDMRKFTIHFLVHTG